uniref:Spondin-like TSP1 domain-containing protein n=1 Tax=Poecilia mexicana TaxID=48701 RepID=A0A3B3XWQ1_9TELE
PGLEGRGPATLRSLCFNTLEGLCISYLLFCCPAVDCIMSPWTAWSGCSVTCGLGSLFRQRDILRDALPGGSCGGAQFDSRACFPRACPVHGHWSAWTEWSECDALCGGGVRQRSRTCSAPPPKNGGRDCEGMTRQSQTCNIHRVLPVHGGWSLWSHWSRCSSDCDSGVQMRKRLCSSPMPQHGGSNCSGSCEGGVLQCRSVPGCHVDGGWGQWGAWSECSVPCGGGVTFRRRLCDNPAPQAGGRGCLGTAEQKKDCNMQMYSVGPWLLWSQWSSCSVSCGGGQQSRSRTCTSPPCHGVSRQSKMCNTQVCLGEVCVGATCPPKNCSWTEWGTWGSCSRSCGVGHQQRIRTFLQPAGNGSWCEDIVGGNLEHRFCNIRPCRGQCCASPSQYASAGTLKFEPTP